MATIPEALTLAVEHRQAGRLAAAEQIYRQILAVEPNQPDVIHLLGALALQAGKLGEAVEYIQRAIQLKGTDGAFYNNLGSAYQEQGMLHEAINCYRQALELRPDYASANHNLGNAFRAQEKLDEAAACYRRALELRPGYAETHASLGYVFHRQGKLDEAIACYRQSLELNPEVAEAHSNLGNALLTQGELDEAMSCCRRALELRPDLAEAHNNLGNAHRELGDLDEAIACYRRALELRPRFAEAHNNLGTAFQGQGSLDEAVPCYRRAIELKPELLEAHNNLGNALLQKTPDEAVACCRRALELKPDYAAAHNNLGNALRDQGDVDGAVNCYRRALELQPDLAVAHSNLLYALYLCSGYDAQTIYEEHRGWNQRFAEPLASFVQPHPNERSADRRLRIGYVSRGFAENVTGVFLLPLLEAHDHERHEIIGYSSVRTPDAITDRCQAQADVWRSVTDVSDERLADIIRQDRIDILVDLTMHAASSRLLVFARKPAPVQVTYLAYAGTTGLDSMDYRLTDPYLDPPAETKCSDERIYSEESIRLPETYWCYRPLVETPPVNALPARQAGRITFGCLNDFGKVTVPTLTAWIGLLRAMPETRLLLHSRSGKGRDRVRDLFAQGGVSPERLTFAGWLPMAGYFQLYHGIDVALDPFPYGGGATTCDALWMGVPVVSLVGQTAVGRGGLSILSNLGLADLVAQDVEQYVRIACELAGDLPRLSRLRATLRERLQNTPLMDAPRFARHVEAAYREMWRRWCAR